MWDLCGYLLDVFDFVVLFVVNYHFFRSQVAGFGLEFFYWTRNGRANAHFTKVLHNFLVLAAVGY